MHKTGLLGLVGNKVDTIEYYTENTKELGPQVEAEKRRTREDEQLAAAFVFFNSRRAAAEASQVSVATSDLTLIVTHLLDDKVKK